MIWHNYIMLLKIRNCLQYNIIKQLLYCGSNNHILPAIMNNGVLTIIALLFLITFIISQLFFSKKAIIKRRLMKVSAKRMSEIKDGETAKIVGKVELIDQPLIAPLSKRKCSYYHVQVEEEIFDGKNFRWKTIIDSEMSNTFVIRDGNNCAYISLKNIKSHIILDKKYTSGGKKGIHPALEAYLNEHNHKKEGVFSDRTLRYREGILEPGEQVAVLGKGEWKNAEDIGLPAKYGRVLVLASDAKQKVYMSDDPDTVVRDVIL